MTCAEALEVEVDVPGERVAVEFAPPEGCWEVAEASSVSIEGSALVLDLRLEAVSDGCASDHDFPLPHGAAGLPDELRGLQVACDSGAILCVDPIRATVVDG